PGRRRGRKGRRGRGTGRCAVVLSGAGQFAEPGSVRGAGRQNAEKRAKIPGRQVPRPLWLALRPITEDFAMSSLQGGSPRGLSRRRFLATASAGALAAWPAWAWAQQAGSPRAEGRDDADNPEKTAAELMTPEIQQAIDK